ncbi:MAG: leucine-rich repeat domain-containing protein [Paludibacteraceae bacterium]|nr:leucine-rich repeat domain-containing protein [Paludibacteraceae bacterium]
MDIPIPVTVIKTRAFYNCRALEELTIWGILETIESEAFGCCPFTSCNLPDSVTEMEFGVFDRAKITVHNNRIFAHLEPDYKGTYTIPDGITTILSSAFSNQPYLTTLVIPDTVTLIDAHNGSKELQRIECHALVPPELFKWLGFQWVDKSIPVCVPAESVELYRNAYEWKKFTNIQSLPAMDKKDSL